jgi:hypothetical protein
MGLGRCKVDNGGCWHETHGDVTFSACLVGNSVYFCSHVLCWSDTSAKTVCGLFTVHGKFLQVCMRHIFPDALLMTMK